MAGAARPESDCVACSKKMNERKRASPIATRLITTPDTMWSTRKLIVATACTDGEERAAERAEQQAEHHAAGPQSHPLRGRAREDRHPRGPVTVPTTMRPSRPMFTMPERSLNRPPSPVR